MRFQREWLLLIGSLLVVGALYNHYLGHSAYLVEIIFVAVGGCLAFLSLRSIAGKETAEDDGMIVSLLSRFVKKEQIAVLLPLFGFVLIAVWSGWKLFVTQDAALRMDDFIVTLFGLSLVLYYYGPTRYAQQKDFVVLYLLFLTVVFAVIWNIYSLVTGESYVKITARSEYYLITAPVVSTLRLFGVAVTSELDTSGHGFSNYIIYQYHGNSLKLGVGTSCSGLYAAGLFFSAFLAFVLVRYKKVDAPIMAGIGLGFAVTWISNIVRMIITIAVGSAYGHPALVFVHGYIGILIFVASISVFWYIIVRWLDRAEPLNPTLRESTADAPA